MRIWNFLVALFRILFFISSETAETPSPTNKPIIAPEPIFRPFEPEKGILERWSLNELKVAIYVRMFDVTDLGLTEAYIARCIGRTEGAMMRKGYRALKRSGKEGQGELLRIVNIYRNSIRKILNIEYATVVFYRSLIYASRENYVGEEVLTYLINKQRGHLSIYFSNEDL